MKTLKKITLYCGKVLVRKEAGWDGQENLLARKKNT